MTMTESSSTLDWKFSQVFGERAPGEDFQDSYVDIISSIEFEKSGDYLAVGDRGGRVVIFERKDAKETKNQQHSRNELEEMDFTAKVHPEFQYKTEFQSHEPEFDYLKSAEIEEKINKVRWCARPNGSLFVFSTNDKTIKLWKVKEDKVKKVKEVDPNPFVCSENVLLGERSFSSGQHTPAVANGYHIEWRENMTKNTSLSGEGHMRIAHDGKAAPARCRKVYAHAHDYNINSISNNSDDETFLSADDLRINLWNLEISDQCFNIIDMKPSNMEDLTEVITSAEFHPTYCNMLAYSSSRGFIRLVDMRQSALCDHSARILQDGESRGFKSFFTEIITSISDIKFASDGRHILSRDYMNLKLWDMHNDASPVAVYKIHEHLRPKVYHVHLFLGHHHAAFLLGSVNVAFVRPLGLLGFDTTYKHPTQNQLAMIGEGSHVYKLSDMYNNDSIFDKFGCCLSGDGLHFATGSYSNLLRIFSFGVGTEEGISIEASKSPNRKTHLQSAPRTRRSSLSNLTRGFYRQGHDHSSSGSNEFSCNLSSKILNLAWHPTTNLIACGAGNSLFMYYA